MNTGPEEPIEIPDDPELEVREFKKQDIFYSEIASYGKEKEIHWELDVKSDEMEFIIKNIKRAEGKSVSFIYYDPKLEKSLSSIFDNARLKPADKFYCTLVWLIKIMSVTSTEKGTRAIYKENGNPRKITPEMFLEKTNCLVDILSDFKNLNGLALATLETIVKIEGLLDEELKNKQEDVEKVLQQINERFHMVKEDLKSSKQTSDKLSDTSIEYSYQKSHTKVRNYLFDGSDLGEEDQAVIENLAICLIYAGRMKKRDDVFILSQALYEMFWEDQKEKMIKKLSLIHI